MQIKGWNSCLLDTRGGTRQHVWFEVWQVRRCVWCGRYFWFEWRRQRHLARCKVHFDRIWSKVRFGLWKSGTR